MIKRLIFDVDGTLIINVNFRDAIKNTFIELGVYSENRVDKFISGINKYESKFNSYKKEEYTKHMSETIGAELGDSFLEIFFKHLKSAITNNNDELIKTIKTLSKDYELVLLTNYFRESQMNRLNAMGIGKYFIDCYGEELIKPNDGAYISSCGKHSQSECVMIGDDLYLDVIRAQELGLKTIFVNTKKVNIGNVNTIVVDRVQDINSKLIEILPANNGAIEGAIKEYKNNDTIDI